MKLATELEPEVPQEEITEADEQPAEPVEAPVEDKPKPEAKAEKPKEEQKEKLVPHGAMHEERERRKAAERELNQLRQNQAVLNDRLQQLWGAVQQPRQEPPQFRDPKNDPDPMDALAHNQNILAQKAHQDALYRQQMEQRAQAQEGARRLAQWGQAQAQEFRRDNPHFDEAYNFIRTMRANELQELGYVGDELLGALWQDEMMIFDRAYRAGRNPAEIAFNLAQKAGWKPRQEEKQAEAEQKIETMQKGTKAAGSLGGGGGDPGQPTAEQIAAMSDEEFEQLKVTLKAKGKRISDVI